MLAKNADKEGGDEERFVVLKREPNHFVLISWSPPPQPLGPNESSASDETRAAQTVPKGGLSCFRRSELPDVILKLWKIKP